MTKTTYIPALALVLAACSNAPIQPPGDGHLRAEKVAPGDTATIPAPVQQVLALPKPKPVPKVETYSVVVHNVKVQELLFALARDAKLNVDIHPGIDGTVTLNAIDQTLQQLLTRIAKQVNLRWELDGPNLAVMPDLPFLRTYKVDYVNMSRDTTGTVTVTSQIGSPGSSAVGASGSSNAGAATTAGSTSSTKVENKAENHFWSRLESNVKDILREEDKTLWETKCERQAAAEQNANGSSLGARAGATAATVAGMLSASPNTSDEASTTSQRSNTSGEQQCGKFQERSTVISNPEAGILTVRATSRQHEKVQEFLSQVLVSARRQVLIEATIAEVQLSDNYQQGIEWSQLRAGAVGFTLIQKAAGKISAPASALFELAYQNPGSRVGNISATAKLLEAFGTVKVLSSPKISVLNNQPAILKIVDNNVYFTVSSNTNQNQTQTVVTYTTTVHSVPVGFVMNVTPQISDDNSILLNIRPTLSRIIGVATDPNPALKAGTATGLAQDIVNEIPIIRSRELESMIRVNNGNIAVMGGIMEDVLDNTDNATPGLNRIPLIGNFFTHRNDTRRKTELVIFLKPVIVNDASIQGDYSGFRNQLPGADFFEKGAIGPPQQQLNIESRMQ
jgi:general secretion pathway protein D